MKWPSILFVLLFSFMVSCSSDDSPSPEEETKNYLPIAEDNQWIYDFNVQAQNNSQMGADTTSMGSITTIESISYRQWENVRHLFGFSDEVFTNKTGDETFIKNPDIELAFNEVIELPAIQIIDDNSNSGTELDTFDLEREFTAIPIPDTLQFSGSITPTIYITGNSVHTNTFANLSLNGTNYDDVYQNETTLNIKVDLTANLTYQNLPLTLTHTWIPEQEFGNLKLWFVNNTGLVRSEIESGIEEVDNTVDVPLFGEVDLADFGITPDAFLSVAQLESVAELTSYELN